MQSTSGMLLEVISDNGGGGSVRIFVCEVDPHVQIAWGEGFAGGGNRLHHLESLAIRSILRGRIASTHVLGELTIFSQRAASSDVESIQSTSVP